MLFFRNLETMNVSPKIVFSPVKKYKLNVNSVTFSFNV